MVKRILRIISCCIYMQLNKSCKVNSLKWKENFLPRYKHSRIENAKFLVYFCLYDWIFAYNKTWNVKLNKKLLNKSWSANTCWRFFVCWVLFWFHATLQNPTAKWDILAECFNEMKLQLSQLIMCLFIYAFLNYFLSELISNAILFWFWFE